MCDCIKAAIDKGYVIQPDMYDEAQHEFRPCNQFYMPLFHNKRKMNFDIKYCPICGEKLPSEE